MTKITCPASYCIHIVKGVCGMDEIDLRWEFISDGGCSQCGYNSGEFGAICNMYMDQRTYDWWQDYKKRHPKYVAEQIVKRIGDEWNPEKEKEKLKAIQDNMK